VGSVQCVSESTVRSHKLCVLVWNCWQWHLHCSDPRVGCSEQSVTSHLILKIILCMDVASHLQTKAGARAAVWQRCLCHKCPLPMWGPPSSWWWLQAA